MTFTENKERSGPKTIEEFKNFNYDVFCNIHKGDDISSHSALEEFLNQKNSVLIDVRETEEQPRLKALNALEIPLASLEQHLQSLKSYQNICFICASGIQKQKAVEITKLIFRKKRSGISPTGAKSVYHEKIKNIFIEGPIDPAFVAESIAKHTVKQVLVVIAYSPGSGSEDKINDKKVESIEFTAYQEMALEKAHEIREEIITKYGLTCAHIYHSLGNIKVGRSVFLCLLQLHIVRKPSMHVTKWWTGSKGSSVVGKEILEDKSHSKENKQ